MTDPFGDPFGDPFSAEGGGGGGNKSVSVSGGDMFGGGDFFSGGSGGGGADDLFAGGSAAVSANAPAPAGGGMDDLFSFGDSAPAVNHSEPVKKTSEAGKASASPPATHMLADDDAASAPARSSSGGNGGGGGDDDGGADENKADNGDVEDDAALAQAIGEEKSAEAKARAEKAESIKANMPKDGEMKNGFVEYIFPNGDMYAGHWENDKVHGEGVMEYQKEGKFEGTFNQGKRDTGKMAFLKTSPKGACVYEGVFKNNKFEGDKGTLTFESGGTYVGQFKDDKFEGEGVYTFGPDKNETVYKGSFKKGKRAGKGTLTYKGGEFKSYDGQFAESVFTEGKLVYSDGGVYDGQFKKDGKKNGKGQLNYPAENQDKLAQFDGQWADDQRKKGKLVWENGDTFNGDFTKDEMAKGVFSFHNGNTYTGPYVDGLMTGKGKYDFADGRSVTGSFEKGILSKGTVTYPDSATYTGAVSEQNLAVREGEGVQKDSNGDVFKGIFAEDKMVKGELKFKDGGVYNGTFDNNERNGVEATMKLADGRLFEGEYKANKMKSGLLTADNGNKYQGAFDENEQKHGTAVASFPSFTFEGEFEAGKPTKGKITYKDTYAKDANGKNRETYEGEIDEQYQPNGSGTITWMDGDSFEGTAQNNVLTGQGVLKLAKNVFTGEIENGVSKHGRMVYGDEETKYACYEGAFNAQAKRDGQGKLEWREGHTFTGEHAVDVHKEGVFTHANGNKFEGSFHVGDFEFSSGTLTFADGVEYAHKKDSEESFISKIDGFYQGLLTASNAVDAQAEDKLKALSLWPQMPAVSTEPRLPSELTEQFTKIKSEGGASTLETLQSKTRDEQEGARNVLDDTRKALQQEENADQQARQRFSSQWTIEPSSSLNKHYHSRLATSQTELDSCVAALDQLAKEREDGQVAFACFTKDLDDLESRIRKVEEEDEGRASLALQLANQANLIAEKKGMLEELQAAAKVLDVMPTLIAGSAAGVESAIKAEMDKVAGRGDAIKAETTKHQALFGSILSAHAEYESAISAVKTKAVSAVVDMLTQGIRSWKASKDAFDELLAQLGEKRKNVDALKDQVKDFASGRSKEVLMLSKRLLTGELQGAISTNDNAMLEQLLSAADHKADPNHPAENGELPMIMAVRRGQNATIKILHKHGGKAGIRDPISDHTSLWVAIEENHFDCLATLIECGADPDDPEDTKSGETILHLAAKNKQADIVDIMIKGKANVNAPSRDGTTPLHSACRVGANDCIMALVKAGSGPNMKNVGGETPLHFITSETMQQFLVERGARPGVLDNGKKPNCTAAQAKALKAGAYKKFLAAAVPANPTNEMSKTDSKWTADSSSDKCYCCATKYSLMNRRHHCRRCGALTCGACSVKKAKATNGQKIRVCDACFNSLS